LNLPVRSATSLPPFDEDQWMPNSTTFCFEISFLIPATQHHMIDCSYLNYIL
jgi:hypothetical protein